MATLLFPCRWQRIGTNPFFIRDDGRRLNVSSLWAYEALGKHRWSCAKIKSNPGVKKLRQTLKTLYGN
uniref:Uncharacterized protein n=1 Tax=Oryza barthii TaxID=65489 RepID=A0A0D3H541_9ORYZ